jgi:hypothetical protein
MTSKDIQRALFRHYDKLNYPYMSANTKALWHEADFVAVSKSNFITECEIKISRSDFFADFKKSEKHTMLNARKLEDWHCPNYFYFVVPSGLVGAEEVPHYAGLLWICTRGKVHVMKRASIIHKDKATDATVIKLLRSIMYKYFNICK